MNIAVMNNNSQTTSDLYKSKNPVPQITSQDLTLELISRHQETSNIVSFEMVVTTANHKLLRHYPGQAIVIEIPLPTGEKVLRTFTIASAPTDTGHIILTIKAGSNANASAHMHQQLKVGDKLSARGPFGRFSVVYHPKQPLLLIGAGSGLTPMLSCLRWLYQRQELAVNVILIQQASTIDDLLCHEELITISSKMPNVSYIHWISRSSEKPINTGLEGRISHNKLHSIVPDLAKRTVLCCGPEGFTENIRSIYRASGGDKPRFLTESFGPKPVTQPTINNSASDSQQNLTIELDGAHFSCTSNESLIDAAARSGIIIPTACRSGICGTCKLKVLEGEAHMHHDGGLSKKEEAQGFILGCSSRATSNMILTRKLDNA